MRRWLSILLVGLASCARTAGPDVAVPSAPVVAERVAPSLPAAASAPPAVLALGEVTLAFFEPGGTGTIDASLQVASDADARVRTCAAEARRGDPSIAGWLILRVELSRYRPPAVRLRETSPLPAKLTQCVTDALRALAPKEEWTSVPELVYVSLR